MVSAIIKTVFLLIVMHWLMVHPAFAQRERAVQRHPDIREALVKIYTVTNTPNYYSPWNMSGANNVSGSGCIIAGNRILTNAHVIADHTFIQVRRYGQARRYKARVIQVSHDADVALLTVDDAAFFANVVPLQFGVLPEPQREVIVYGFPVGGDSLSITRGVLSRVEHQRYTHSGRSFLAGQIDAAINAGNSGGPVLVNDRLVGVVMQAHSPQYSENMGHMVPVSVIQHFLQDIADGRYDGFPALGFVTQNLDNPHMKRQYGMASPQTGIVVRRVLLGSPATDKIQPGDVVVAIDGQPIADDGTVEFRPRERTSYTYYVERRQVGERVHIEVLRHGTITQVILPLTRTHRDYELVPLEQYDHMPRYFIYGGIVFSPLTTNVLKSWGQHWKRDAPTAFLSELLHWPTQERREVVVALQVLPADVNIGYHDVRCWIVMEVNGKTFRDFHEFLQHVMVSTDPLTVFQNPQGFQMVIDREKAQASHASILRMYHIQADRSPDLRTPGPSENS
jgi:S1-C subfamily serine protease